MQRGTTALVIAALLCGGGFLAYELVLRQGRQARHLQDQRLLPPDVTLEMIAAFSLLTNEGTVAISRNGENDWNITGPLEVPAENVTVEGLLENLVNTEAERLDVFPENPADFGFEEPQQVFELLLEGGGTVAVRIGHTTFDNSGLYAQVDNGPVRILESSTHSQLNPTLFALRDKTLTAWSSEDLATLTIEHSSETVNETIVLQAEPPFWRIESPRPLETDPDAIDHLLAQLSTLQATGFVSSDQSDISVFGLEPPTILLSATFTDGDRQTLSLGTTTGSAAPTIYATSSLLASGDSSAIATLAQDTVDRLPTTLTALRDKRLATITPALYAQIDIEATDTTLSRTLRPTETEDDLYDDWVTDDQPERVFSLEGILTPLIDVRAIAFIHLEPISLESSDLAEDLIQESETNESDTTNAPEAPGIETEIALSALANPDLVFTFTPIDGVTNEALTLEFAATAEALYVRSSEHEDLLVLDREFFDLLNAAVGTLRPL